ncbi:InlB B-repeat-containing protein [Mediterraneibacter sp. NSJ-55]|uniref:InlB B-repeat-containing protein n=1 Tax=Mediterraneibacter hominis TaxID=2763054 RepID=A0A923RQT3_9FIRM|nr:InlB B-repeat-containing protein [Mediterraneibacter hominis]MBC5687677.1 InlB B-repeat-containing protein [Mediterraneibacter hominis]
MFLLGGGAVTVTNATQTEQKQYATLQEAVANAQDGDTITLNKNVTLSETISIDKSLILDGQSFQITSELNESNQDMFYVSAGGELTLKNLIIDGNARNKSAYLIRVSGGELRTQIGTKLTNSSFSAVFITDGSFAMEAGEISGNTYSENNSIGAAVTVNTGGIFTMQDGKIAGNSAPNSSQGSAGILVNSGGTAYLYGGTLEENTAAASPAVTVSGELEISGTSILNNRATKWAGAMAVYSGTVTMNSGSISGNTAQDGNGGAIYVEGYEEHPGSFVMNGGSITENAAAYDGGAIFGYVDIISDSDLGMAVIEINGGTIKGNKDQNAGETVNGAVFIRPGVQLRFSGTPEISGLNGIEAVDYDTLEANSDFQMIQVTKEFSPVNPVTLEIWGDYLPGQRIVEYSDGIEADPEDFIAPVQNYGYQKEGKYLYTEVKRKVLFKDGIENTYEELSYWSFVDDTVKKPEDDTVKKDGYTLDGWYTDSSLTKKWDFENDKIPREEGNFILYAEWSVIPAQAPILPTNPKIELACSDMEGTVLSPEVEEKEAYTYIYRWENEEGEPVGDDSTLMVISPANGETALYTLTVTAVRKDNGQTAQASTTYTVTRKEHKPGKEWKFDGNSHWNECSVCGIKQNEASHTFKWVTDKNATKTEPGKKHEECTSCGYAKEAVIIPAFDTSKEDMEKVEEKPSGAVGEDGKIKGSPQTGDNTNPVSWCILLLVSAVALGGTVMFIQKRKS